MLENPTFTNGDYSLIEELPTPRPNSLLLGQKGTFNAGLGKGNMKNGVKRQSGIFLLLILPLLLSCASAPTRQTELRDAEAYCERGSEHLRRNEYDQAISDLNKALEIDPRFAKAYSIRGFIYDKKGQYDQAIDDFISAHNQKAAPFQMDQTLCQISTPKT
jgi:tetratricopeptide (TPR) repeat protein